MTSSVLPRLYLITDRHNTSDRPLQSVIQESLVAGTTLFQLREKDLNTQQLLSLAQDLLREARQQHAMMLINDRIDIVKAIGADGVHLRSDSLSIQQARQILGPQSLIGKSTHNLDEVLTASAEGADFVVLGPIYDTPSKRTFGPPIGLAALKEACQQCTLPIFAIGGITPEHAQSVREAGAYGVAVISAILQSTTITSSTHQFLDALNRP